MVPVSDIAPSATRLIVPRSGGWMPRTDEFIKQLEEFLWYYRFGSPLVLCEWPKFFESEGGQKAAKTGSLVKLTYMVGRIAQLARSKDYGFGLVPVNRWKGTMDKPAVEHRIERILGAEACGGFYSHVWDAVGIGLWYRGAF